MSKNILSVDTTTAYLGISATRAAQQIQYTPRIGVQDTGAGALETAGAIWKQETLIGSALTYGLPSRSDLSREDTGFNPYRFWADHRDEYADIEKHIRTGKFDEVSSELGFKYKVERLREEQRLRDTIAGGSGLGVILGMGLSLVDVATLVPFAGLYKKGSSALKLAKIAGASGAMVAGQEAALHQMQELRTLKESFLNIGMATVVGGGLGAIGMGIGPGARRAGDALSNTNARIRAAIDTYRENFEVGAKADGAEMNAAEHLSRPYTSSTRSAGAAAVRQMDHTPVSKTRDWVESMAERVRKGESLSMLERAQLKGVEVAAGTARAFRMNQLFGTPARRAMHWTSERMREFAAKMMDQGGTITRSMERGEAVDAVAEDLRHLYMQELHSIQQAHEDAVRRLNIAMGGSKSVMGQELRQTAARVKNFANDVVGREGKSARFNKIEAWEFADATKAALFERIDDEAYQSRLISEYGEDNARLITSAAKEQAEMIQRANLAMEEELVNHGILKENQRMGRDYRMAQLWDTKAIAAKEDEFRLFLKEVLVNDPDAAWLEEATLLTKEQFNKLGKETVVIKREGAEYIVISPERGVDLKSEILSDWHGDEITRTINDLEARARALEVEAEQAKVDAIEAGWEVLRKEGVFNRARITEAERAVRLQQQELAVLRDDLDRARAEEREAALAIRAARQKARDRQFTPEGQRTPESRKVRDLRQRLAEATRNREYRQKRLDQAVARAERTEHWLKIAKEKRAAAQESLYEARRLRKEARTGARKASRLHSQVVKKLEKESKKPPLDVLIDSIINNMRGNTLPMGALDGEVFQSGRVRERVLRLTKEQRQRAEELGFLRGDLYGVLERQYHDLSARLALQRVFGTQEWTDIAKEIREDYSRLKATAKYHGASEKQIASLENEWKMAEQDIEGLWLRLLGRYKLPDSTDNVFHWVGQTFRAYNFTRFGAGFLLSSITDMANVALTVGFGNTIRGVARIARRDFMDTLDNREIRNFVYGSERTMHNSRAFKIADVEDMSHQSGVGAYGSTMHRVTSTIDRAVTGMSEKVNLISGLQAWNTRWKALVMDLQLRELTHQLRNYDDLLAKAREGDRKARLQVGSLARLGLGEDQVRVVRKYMDAHLTPDESLDVTGLKASSPEAFRYVFTALRRAADTAIMTPGIGDTPLLMSDGLWKTLMQFQSYGHVIVNRYMVPAMQRAWTYQDLDAVISMGFAAVLGTAVVVAKDIVNHGTVRERDLSEWAYDIIDRSGYLAWTAPYSGAAWRILFDKQTSKYSYYNDFVGQFLGPTYGTAQDIARFGFAVDEQGSEEIINKGMRLLPYSDIFRAAARIAEAATGE